MITGYSGMSLASMQQETARRRQVADAIAEMLAEAPPVVVRACLELLATLKTSQEAVQGSPNLDQPHKAVRTWEELLTLLVGLVRRMSEVKAGAMSKYRDKNRDVATLSRRFEALRAAHEEALLMLELAYELINAGDEFLAPEELLKESALILLLELEADLYVCRLKRDDPSGNPRDGDTWTNVATDSLTLNSTPLFVRDLEETHPSHPVMRAVHADSSVWFVVSDDLRASEMGGESFDCIPYKEGFRSRLAFILREASGEPFGLIMLYSRRLHFFDKYQTTFLADCARIVSLTVGRRQQACRNALAKAAGGMAHVGNNALAILKDSVGLMLDEASMLKKARREAIDAADAALTSASPSTVPAEFYQAVERLLAITESMNLDRHDQRLQQINAAADRLAGAIATLESSVDRPRFAPFTLGQEFLDLDPACPPLCFRK
ncbi:hypothetical protein [Megalodesulfovibrio paquesii]